MMTWNFAFLALDQIVNHAAKWLYMSGGQYNVPIVFRGPGGAAHVGCSQHSQVVDTYYVHAPGVKVVSVNPADAKGLLKTSIRDDNPVIFIESEMMCSWLGMVPDGEYTIPLGVGDIKRPGSDVILVAWNKTVSICEEAAAELAKDGD